MRPLIIHLLSTAALGFAVAAHAEEQAPALAPVVVTAPLDQAVQLDRTGAVLADIPRSIGIVDRSLLEAQGATRLTDAVRDLSGVAQGGQFAFGFFDRVIIRGLNASYLNDGLPDGTSDLTGYTRSLIGVERVEVLKGPGSALFGSAEPGGTINLVHARPTDQPELSGSEQYGSYNTSTTALAVGGPTGLKDVDWRLDGGYQNSDGYRRLASRTTDLLGSVSFRPTHHDIEARAEYHHLENTPDATGLPFSPPNGVGKPLPVSTDLTYYTPYAEARQDISRLFLSDAWQVSALLTVNIRAGYAHRDVDLTRNAGGSVTSLGGVYALTKRQLREQSDHFDDTNLQIEPNWTFTLAGMRHLLLTGVEVRRIEGVTTRATADLPNIANVFSPVVTDGPAASLTFKCDSAHNCDNARLGATFAGIYATDQIEVNDRLKLRLSARQDGFDTRGEARALLPANGGQQQPCVPATAAACPWVPGAPVKRTDDLMSFDVGAVYVLAPALSVFTGYSSAAYPIFNTEEPESVGQTPERGTQLEVGTRLQAGPFLSLTSSVYAATRRNVFTQLTEPNPNGPGNLTVAQTFAYRVRGWETDLKLQPTRPWAVLANLAIQDGEITRYPQTPADLGHPIPSVPKVLANLWSSYELPPAATAGGAPAQLSLGVRYRGTEFADAGQTRKVPGVVIADGEAAWPIGKVKLALGIDNLFDRRVFLYGDGTGGGALPGAGRTAFIRLSTRVW